MKVKKTGFSDRLDVDREEKPSKMTPPFLAWTTDKMELPLTDLKNTMIGVGWHV